MQSLTIVHLHIIYDHYVQKQVLTFYMPVNVD